MYRAGRKNSLNIAEEITVPKPFPNNRLPRQLPPASFGTMELENLLKPLRHHSTTVMRCLIGALNWSPIMPRHASLSDSQGKCFPALHGLPRRLKMCLEFTRSGHAGKISKSM